MAGRSTLALVVAASLTLPLGAQQAMAEEGPGAFGGSGDFSLTGSIGMAMLQANEYVYGAEGEKVSQLIWDSDGVPVATFEAEWRASPRWTLLGSLSLGLENTGYMEDYDWLVEGRDWSERSRHTETPLQRYLAFDLGARYDFLVRERGSLGLLGGFRYTDVKWTAYGGDFLYTNTDFRDTAGHFPEGEKGISYRQMLPALYLGPSGSLRAWGLDFSASALGGVSIEAGDQDNHWQRDLYFEEDFDPAPYVSLQARVAWPIGPSASLFLGTRYERHFIMKGGTTTTDTTTGEVEFTGGDAAGASFEALRIDAGLTVGF